MYDADRIQELIGQLGARLRPESPSITSLQLIVEDQQQRLTACDHMVQQQQLMLDEYRTLLDHQAGLLEEQKTIIARTWSLVQALERWPDDPCQELVQQIKQVLEQEKW